MYQQLAGTDGLILQRVVTPKRLGQWVRAVAEQTFPKKRGRQAGIISLLGVNQPQLRGVMHGNDFNPQLRTIAEMATKLEYADVDVFLTRVRIDLERLDAGQPVPSLLSTSQPLESGGQTIADASGQPRHLSLTPRVNTGHSDAIPRTDEVGDVGGSIHSLTPNEERIVHALMVRISTAIALFGHGRSGPDAGAGHSTGTTPTDPEIRGPRPPRSPRGPKRPRGR
jgi:hypothetical protein